MATESKQFSRTFGVLSLIVGVAPLAVDTSLPAMGDMARGIGTTVGNIQTTISAFFLGLAAGQLAWGTLADRFGRRPTLLAGLSTYVLAAVALGLSSSLEPMIGLRFIQGVGSAAVFIMSRAVARDLFDVTTSARMFARLFQAVGLFAVICPIIGGQLTELFGWRAVFFFMAAWAFIGLAVVVFRLDESLAEPDRDALRVSQIFSSFGSLFGDAPFRGYLLVGAGGYVGLFAILAGMPVVVINYLGESPAVFGYLYSSVMIVYLAATAVSERVIRKIGAEPTATLGVGIIALAAALTVAAAAADYVTLATTVVVNATIMIGFAFTMPAVTAGALKNFHHMAGRATALMGCTHQAIGAISVFMIGLATDGTPRPHTIAMACAGLIAVGAYVLMVKPLKRPVA